MQPAHARRMLACMASLAGLLSCRMSTSKHSFRHMLQKNGLQFEATVRKPEASNPRFGFMLPWHEHHPYYRCSAHLMYSLLNAAAAQLGPLCLPLRLAMLTGAHAMLLLLLLQQAWLAAGSSWRLRWGRR